MNVTISYPENFPITGWEKVVFNRLLKNMFVKEWVDVCDLEKLRSKFTTNEDDDSQKELRKVFRLMHCSDFKDLGKEIVDDLPAKVGEFLGVEITEISEPKEDDILNSGFDILKKRSKPIGTVLVVVSIVSAMIFYGILFARYSNNSVSDTVRLRSILSHNIQDSGTAVQKVPGNVFPSSYNSQSQEFCSGDALICVMAETSKPDALIKTLATSLPKGTAKRYAVQLKVVGQVDEDR